MILCLLLRWQNEQKTDFNFVVITRLSTAANKKVPAMAVRFVLSIAGIFN